MQVILLSGALAENDGRNEFLFAAALYLKKKYQEGFYDKLVGMNNCFEAPLEEKEIASIYKSASEGGWETWSCKKAPICHYCDRKLCSLREYGVGRQRNNRFTGADCWGELSKVMAETPYYTWQVRINAESEFKTVKIDRVGDLRNQATVQECCWRDLSWAPFRVKDNDWVATVNKAMEGIDERQIPVPKGTDTTEMGELHDLFMQYLLRRRAKNGQPCMVAAGQVYYAEGIHYFTTRSILAFFRYEKFSLAKINLREQLIAYGCLEAELHYKNAQGIEKAIPCWKKMEDEELLEMADLYNDTHGADMEILQAVKPNKEQAEGGGDEGVKF
jgi:hypothetical protein